MVTSGGLVGGFSATIAGGKFVDGFKQGLITAGLNHVAHMGDGPDDNGYDESGKKVNNNGGDKTDYLYDKDGNVISSTSVKVTITHGGELNSSFEGYGYRHYNFGTGGALYDPSWDMFQLYAGGTELKAGFGVFKMGLTRVLKSEYGIRTALGGSSTMLESSYYFTRTLGINMKMGFRLPTIMGISTNNLGMFLGRNAPIIGGAIMYDGARRIYNSFQNFGK